MSAPLHRRPSPPSRFPVIRSMRRLLPAFALAALASCLLTLPAAASAARPCAGSGARPTAANAARVRHATLCLLNRQRAAHGLPRLREQRSLAHAARSYAHQMVRHRFFDHVSPSGSTMAQRVKRTRYLRGVRGWSLGENLAWGAGSSATPANIVRAWMRSPGHRRNILDGTFREIGIGIAAGAPTGTPGGATYVNEFGRRS
jgi:uncharacterized protein YkwD